MLCLRILFYKSGSDQYPNRMRKNDMKGIILCYRIKLYFIPIHFHPLLPIRPSALQFCPSELSSLSKNWGNSQMKPFMSSIVTWIQSSLTAS